METLTKSNEFGGTVDSATDIAHRAIDMAAGATRPAVDRMASNVHQAVDKLAGVACHAAESIDARSEKLREAGSRMAGGFRSRLHEQPVATLGIALASGVLLGWLLRQR